MASQNIVGLDLNVDQDYIAKTVQDAVMLGIAESLNGKNEIVSQVVTAVLRTRVDEHGKLSSYNNDNKYSLLDYYVRTLITDVVQDEMKALVEEKRPEIATMIRKELMKKINTEKFVGAFIDEVGSATRDTWCPRINVEFEKRRED